MPINGTGSLTSLACCNDKLYGTGPVDFKAHVYRYDGGFEFDDVLFAGKIYNKTSLDDVILFEAGFIFVLKFSPFSFEILKSNEKIAVNEGYKGFIGNRFILSLCEASFE